MSFSAPRADSTTIGVLPALANLTADVDAVEVGQAEIEDDQVGRVTVDRFERGVTGHRRQHFVAARAKERRDGRQEVRLVVDDEDAFSHQALHDR